MNTDFIYSVLSWATTIFVFTVGIGIFSILVLYIIDVTQTEQTIRRNFPVIGRFRYWFEHIGEFFRQYFFAMDREEMPFNRAERSWVYRAAKNVDSTIAFGSTRSLAHSGEVLFLSCPFPTLSEDAALPRTLVIGEGVAQKPYATNSLFNVSGMSFGAISKQAVLALSRGAKSAGAWMNTGEGGLSPYHIEGGADIVFQIGTAKYGVRDEAGNLSDDKLKAIAKHEQVKMFEIKLSQGAKPGKGGILPGRKVTQEIATIRGIKVGEDSISPNGHTDIKNNDELLDMIERVRKVTGKPVGFKAVVGRQEFYDSLFEDINKRGIESAPDFITIDSADGGTGAAPQSLMDYVGLPLKESLPFVVDKLIEYKLRDRVKVISSGKLVTPSNVAWALAMGADFVTSARGFMFSLGCIQALQCNKNNCPTGIATQDPKFQKGLDPKNKAVRVASYIENMVYEVGTIAHSCGVKEPRELNRFHAKVTIENGKSELIANLYPLPEKQRSPHQNTAQ